MVAEADKRREEASALGLSDDRYDRSDNYDRTDRNETDGQN